MIFSGMKIVPALVAITVLSQAPLSLGGYARGVHHHRRSLQAGCNYPRIRVKRADAGSVELPLSQIQLLQSEYSAFKGWVINNSNSSASTDTGNYIAQLKQEFTAYDSWMSAWFDSALNTGSLSTAPTPQTSPPNSSFSSPTPVPSPLTSFTSANEITRAPLSVPASSASIQASSSSSTSGSVPSGASSSSSSFNAEASDNVVVYYGQSPATSQVKLSDLCADKSINIVILAFLTTFFGPGGFPIVNFGTACSGVSSTAATAQGATGLLSCLDMATDIQNCQSAGKKVLLSLGGADAVSAFTSDSQVSTFANQLTNLFTSGSDSSLSALRPFGRDVKLDGFDIDNEDHSNAYYSTFVTSLRSALNEDKSKTYYISSAPQCPRPDLSIPLDAMQTMDFIFVQFYNNGLCNVGQSGFLSSFRAWSSDLSAKGGGPRLFIGAPACSACAGSGYLDSGTIGGVIQSAKAAKVGNFGGMMLWDGAEAVTNGNYQDEVKSALN